MAVKKRKTTARKTAPRRRRASTPAKTSYRMRGISQPKTSFVTDLIDGVVLGATQYATNMIIEKTKIREKVSDKIIGGVLVAVGAGVSNQLGKKNKMLKKIGDGVTATGVIIGARSFSEKKLAGDDLLGDELLGASDQQLVNMLGEMGASNMLGASNDISGEEYSVAGSNSFQM